jgi:hypothetical protein
MGVRILVSSILMYGRDARLLETQAWVLERAGHRGRTVSTFDDLEHLLSTEETDLLVLCHSLSMEECGRSIALTIPWPRTKSLILIAGPKGCHAQKDAMPKSWERRSTLLDGRRSLFQPSVPSSSPRATPTLTPANLRLGYFSCSENYQ